MYIYTFNGDDKDDDDDDDDDGNNNVSLFCQYN